MKNLYSIKKNSMNIEYYTLGEIYDIHPLMRTYRSHRDNPTLADYTLTAKVIDENGNEYDFKHSHNKDLLHGRPLPYDIRDCPRAGSIIDTKTGECTDRCMIDYDCALGYKCINNQCIRESCKTDDDCSSKKCSKNEGICEPLKCSDKIRKDFPTNFYMLKNVTNDLIPVPYQHDRCISTSHYHLKGRDNIPDSIVNDSRYAGMYN